MGERRIHRHRVAEGSAIVGVSERVEREQKVAKEPWLDKSKETFFIKFLQTHFLEPVFEESFSGKSADFLYFLRLTPLFQTLSGATRGEYRGDWNNRRRSQCSATSRLIPDF